MRRAHASEPDDHDLDPLVSTLPTRLGGARVTPHPLRDRIGPYPKVDAPSWRTEVIVRWRALREHFEGSAWTSLILRGLILVVAILAFAWIGRAAAHAPVAASPATDAGTLPASSTSALPASALPAPALPSATSAPAPAPQAPTVAAAGHTRATNEDPVYVNHAGAEDLRRLPGVGVKRADAILALRQRVGRFQRVEDLLRVKGIGRSTLRKWRPLLRLDVPDAGAAR